MRAKEYKQCIECGDDILVIFGFPQSEGLYTANGLVCCKCSKKSHIKKKYGVS